VPNIRIADPKSCQCGEVLKGVIKPWQCKVYGLACTPETPLGALMVSSEGACAAYYNYGGAQMKAPKTIATASEPLAVRPEARP
jgi:hydrogenase expression/formation protein HypD